VKILVAPCAYKGTLQASDLARAIAQGLNDGLEQQSLKAETEPKVEIKLAPVADGGDDTIACLHLARGGDFL
jgi:glycerate kinase